MDYDFPFSWEYYFLFQLTHIFQRGRLKRVETTNHLVFGDMTSFVFFFDVGFDVISCPSVTLMKFDF